MWPLALEVHAQASASIELEWRAPAGCPSGADVLRRIDALAGSAGAVETPLHATATIARSRGGLLHLQLRVRAGAVAGERHLDGKSCDDLAGAAAVTLVLLLQSGQPLPAASPRPAAAAPQPTASPSGTSRPPAASAPQPSAAAPQPSTPQAGTPATPSTARSVDAEAQPSADEPSSAGSRRPFRVLVQLPALTSNFGLLPGPSLGVAFATGLEFSRALVLAEGSLWLPQRWQSELRPDAGVRVDRVEVSLRACWVFAYGQFTLAPCAAASLEHLWARGEGRRVAAQTAASTWLAAGLGARARWQLTSWLGLVVLAEAQVGAARPIVYIEGVGRLGQLGPAAVELGVGSEWIL